jgi:hypothetical protein
MSRHVIPGRAFGADPESISPSIRAAQWIPGLVLTHHPGMTRSCLAVTVPCHLPCQRTETIATRLRNTTSQRKMRRDKTERDDMSFSLSRALAVAALLAAAIGSASAQTTARPPAGGVASAPDAMIFYVAHGNDGACGPGCSDWIAAEGTVQWDTYKRLINILDRQNGRKLPLVIHAFGESNLNVAVSLGRIIRERSIDTMEGATEVSACAGKSEADCFALKRPGGPLDATLATKDARCDTTCVLMLAGGVHRTLRPGTRVILSGMAIRNRMVPNVSDEHREGLAAVYGEQFRVYLREMGVDTELLDIVDRNSAQHHATEVPMADWARLHLVTAAPQ